MHTVHLEVLGQVAPRDALHISPEGVLSGALQSPGQVRARQPAG